MGLGSNEACDVGLDWSQKLLKDGNLEEIRKRQLVQVQGTMLKKEEEDERQAIGVPSTPLRCPRCDSKNTKFCYYNNYSRSQPRHFCKSCRRHWTNGGTLRNVPVGGSRKNKRPKSSHPSTNLVRKYQIFDQDDNIGYMKQSKPQLHQEDEHHQHMQQFPLQQFVPNLALLHPPTPSSSSSNYNSSSSSISIIGRNGSNALSSLLSSLPPVNPLVDPLFLASNSSVSLPPLQPTSGIFPLMRLMEENGDDAEVKFGLTTSSSAVDEEIASTVPWQSTDLLPMCSLANVSSGLELSSTGGGDFWNYWDELTGFGIPPGKHGSP